MKTLTNHLKTLRPLLLALLFLSFGFSVQGQKEMNKKKKDQDKTYIKTTQTGITYEIIGWEEDVVYNPHSFTWFAWEEPIVVEKKQEYKTMIPVSAFTRPPVFTGDGACLAATDMMACTNRELQEYVQEKMTEYPQPAKRLGQEGLEYVTFTLNEEGKFEGNLSVLSKDKPCEGCAEAAVDIVAGMEDMWYPAIKDGKTVETQLTIPIRFELAFVEN